MLQPFQRMILTSTLLLAAPLRFAVTDSCSSLKRNIPLRIAYAQYFNEVEGRTLSLKVSVGRQYQKTPDFLHRVGCTISAKYRNEPRWSALIFSNYEVAKKYTPPDSIENEPPEYLGACLFAHEEMECGYW